MYYAGIGSEVVANEYHELIKQFAVILSQNGYILRCGGELGTSDLFEIGCDSINGKKEVYLPWKKFNNKSSKRIVRMHDAFVIAKRHCADWSCLSPGVKKQLARNVHKVLGGNLKFPSSFILCYYSTRGYDINVNHVLAIANEYNIPVFNIGVYTDLNTCIDDFIQFVNSVN